VSEPENRVETGTGEIQDAEILPPPSSGSEVAKASPEAIARDAGTGRFKPGNKSGGRRPMPPEVRRILEAADEDAAKVLVAGLKAMRFTGDMESVPDWKTRHLYASTIHDRLHGKPVQAVEGSDGGPLQFGVIVLPVEELEDGE
jgi:hypothetical protein